MIVTRGLATPTSSCAGPAVTSAITIGNFDGVHRGHQTMLARLVNVATARGLAICALTFEPHPREVFTPQQAPTRLTSLREKLELLAVHGVQRAHVAHFTRAFAGMSPQDFIERVLVNTLGARWILVGEDFRFGARRAGDVALLRAEGGRCGFEVETMSNVELDGLRISSSEVRTALAAGELDRAALLLGRRYSISGRVVHGDKLGRKLGFATANIQLKHNRPPLAGIFAVRLHGADGSGGGVRDGVASLGVRPTVKAAGAAPVLEVHLFDYSGEFYGRHVRVEFLRKIRDEEKYSNLEALNAKIASDCDAARKILLEIGND